MGRLQEFMDKMERGEDEPAQIRPDHEEILNQQKQADLKRAQARSVARPIKKEIRHSQIEGRYIRPQEVKKEIEKLEQAKREAEERRKGFFHRIFFKRKKTQPATDEQVSPDKVAKPDSDVSANKKNDKQEAAEAQKKKKAEQIRRLRGITLAKMRDEKEAEERYRAVNKLSTEEVGDYDADSLTEDEDIIPREENVIPQEPDPVPADENRFSFTAAVQRLSDPAEYREPSAVRPEYQDPAGWQEYQEPAGWQEYQEPSAAQPEAGFSDEAAYPDPVDEIEAARLLFAPIPTHEPDHVIATALSAAVGFVYWDEDDRIADRIITIRRLFSKQGDILIEAFCHDIAAPRLIPFSRGIKMYNLQTMKAYGNPRDFLLYHVTGLSENTQIGSSGFASALSVVRYELTALVYVAKSDFDRTDEENRLMLSYISQRCPTIDFDENEMLDYIAMLVPDEQSFAEALDIVVRQPQEIVFLFVRTFLQMMLADGVLHENERELLAELLYLLQTEGIDLGRIGLE